MSRAKTPTSDPIMEDVGLTSPKPSPRIRVPHSHAQLGSDLPGKVPQQQFHTVPKSHHPTRKRTSSSAPGLLTPKGGVSGRGYFCWIQLIIVFIILCCQIPLLIRYLNLFPSNRIGRGRFAYATLLCQDDMADASGVLVHSLLKTGTPYDVIVLAANISADKSAMLQALGAKIEPIHSPIPYPYPLPFTKGRQSINKPCSYFKLLLWNLTRYDRIVYLDNDMLVVSPIDDLFSRPPLAAVPDSMPPDRFNSGLMVLKPKTSTFSDMMLRVNTTASPNVGDQGTLPQNLPICCCTLYILFTWMMILLILSVTNYS